MTMTTILRRALSLAGLVLLGACGNGNMDAAALVKALPKAVMGKKTTPAPITGAQMAQALGATDKPVSLFVVEDRKLQFLMFEIQRNGVYQTFGSSSRQVVVMRDGMIYSTRGLGGDLMSGEEDALIAAVRHRTQGAFPYKMRFLTSDNRTVTLEFACALFNGEQKQVALGLVNEPGTVVTAKCSGDSGAFTNTYVVARDGFVLSARQWMGDYIGYMGTQALRR